MSRPCWSFFLHPRKCPIPPGQPVSNSFLLRSFEAAEGGGDVCHKHPDTWKNNWFLRHDNTPMHTSLVQQFLTSRNSDSPSHSPDFTPWDYFLFPKMKLWLKGCRLESQNRKRLLTHIWEIPDAWNQGKHTGIAAHMPKGTTSKEMVETGSYGKKFFLWSNSWKCCAATLFIQWFFEKKVKLLVLRNQLSVVAKNGFSGSTAVPPYPLIQYLQFQLSMVYCGSPPNLKVIETDILQSCQARTGHNMVKPSRSNAPSTLLNFLWPHTHISPQNFTTILLLAFSLLPLIVMLSQCLCSESPHLFINS
jgi:hypothetical protein